MAIKGGSSKLGGQALQELPVEFPLKRLCPRVKMKTRTAWYGKSQDIGNLTFPPPEVLLPTCIDFSKCKPELFSGQYSARR